MASPVSSTLLTVASPTFTPALQPPPGVVSNPEHPESLAKLSNIAISICAALVTIFFIARCYCRWWVKSTFIFEDVLATTAWAGTVAYCGIMGSTMAHHGGEHAWDITRAQFSEASYWFNVASIEYGVMIGVTKITVLTLYRRVFSPVLWSWFDIAIVSLIVILALFYGITTFFKIFECSPRAKIFNSHIPGHCYDVAMILKTSGFFNAVTDYVILFLPVHSVWALQMSKAKKLLVVLVFTFGLCAPIFATIGCVVRLKNSSNPDTSWRQPDILLWGAAELTSGNLCICFPEMGAIFRSRVRRRGSRGTPRRPTASELHPYKEPSGLSYQLKKRIKKNDPYRVTSLVETAMTTNAADAGTYTEIDDAASYGVKITPEHSQKGEKSIDAPLDNRSIMRISEIGVERHEAV